MGVLVPLKKGYGGGCRKKIEAIIGEQNELS